MELTREQILKMNNQELNEATAIHIMGWVRKTATDGITEFWDDGTISGGKWLEPVTGSAWKMDDYSNVWNPADNITIAYEVLEKMRRPFSKRKCFAQTMQDTMNRELIENDADIRIAPEEVVWHLTPINICRAALLTTWISKHDW